MSLSLLSFTAICGEDGDFNIGQKAFSAQDYDKAFEAWLPLANNGYIDAQVTIAFLYRTGSGTKKNIELSNYWYELAAKSGHLEAIYQLAEAYRLGDGYEKNTEKAKEYYVKSLCGGFLTSRHGLVALYQSGDLVPESEARKGALDKEAEKLRDPAYFKYLVKKTRSNLDKNNGLSDCKSQVLGE